jgi:ribosomal subunit interface protein
VEIVITGRHTEITDRFRRAAEEKLAKIAPLTPKALRADVELSHERNPRQTQTAEKVEITVRGKGPVVRAEACADDPTAALDLALGKLVERLRRSRDRRKVHHGRQTPPSLRLSAVEAASMDVTPAQGLGLPSAGLNGTADAAAAIDAADGDDAPTGVSPVVIRTKEHPAVPMTLDQALYEMELVGHDFFLFVDAGCGLPSVVYRRRGWNYGVIRLTGRQGDERQGAEEVDGVAAASMAR